MSGDSIREKEAFASRFIVAPQDLNEVDFQNGICDVLDTRTLDSNGSATVVFSDLRWETAEKEAEKLNSSLIVEFSNGVRVLNCTGHDMTFLDQGEVVIVPSSGYVLNATIGERRVSINDKYELVRIEAQPEARGRAIVKDLREKIPGVLLAGSLLAAQAYEGVVSLVPAPGFERVKGPDKRMRIDKFTLGK